MPEDNKAALETFKLFELMAGNQRSQLSLQRPGHLRVFVGCLFPQNYSSSEYQLLSALGGGGVATRLKTEFKFSICSSWLPLPLLVFGMWMLRALKEPVELFSWQRQSPSLSQKAGALGGSRLGVREAGAGCPGPTPLRVSEQSHVSMATFLTTSFRKYFSASLLIASCRNLNDLLQDNILP